LSGLLDISMLVRYLTGDPPEMAERAARIIDWEENLLVTDVVIAETAYILTSVYKIPGEAVVVHLMLFVQKSNIQPFAFLDSAEAAIEGANVRGIYNPGDEAPLTLQEFLDHAAVHWGTPKPWWARPGLSAWQPGALKLMH
jgi:hypothetical protein